MKTLITKLIIWYLKKNNGVLINDMCVIRLFDKTFYQNLIEYYDGHFEEI